MYALNETSYEQKCSFKIVIFFIFRCKASFCYYYFAFFPPLLLSRSRMKGKKVYSLIKNTMEIFYIIHTIYMLRSFACLFVNSFQIFSVYIYTYWKFCMGNTKRKLLSTDKYSLIHPQFSFVTCISQLRFLHSFIHPNEISCRKYTTSKKGNSNRSIFFCSFLILFVNVPVVRS